MCKTFKRFAAMGAAVMMMASISSMGVSALDNTYSLYISNSANVNTKKCAAGTSHKDGWITTTVNLDKVSSGAGITYSTYVNGNFVGSSSKISKVGSYPKDYSNYQIKNKKPITIQVNLAPSSAGVGSSASGWVSGS
ncbi:MAG: hypothetical protein K2F81_08595 [Ruminococcus sp.]|nr:hypothetical protein [Ruminococcus sp.]